MMRGFWVGLLSLVAITAHADAVGRYMNIANNIPKMEMKADPEAQAWARSARNLLDLTSETIAETLLLANASATQQGAALFCLPATTALNSTLINNIILETYQHLSSPVSEKDKMTVSQIALLGITQQYPCSEPLANKVSQQQAAQQKLMHMDAVN